MLFWAGSYFINSKQRIVWQKKKKKMLLEIIETTSSQAIIKTKEVPEIRSESVRKGFQSKPRKQFWAFWVTSLAYLSLPNTIPQI